MLHFSTINYKKKCAVVERSGKKAVASFIVSFTCISNPVVCKMTSKNKNIHSQLLHQPHAWLCNRWTLCSNMQVHMIIRCERNTYSNPNLNISTAKQQLYQKQHKKHDVICTVAVKHMMSTTTLSQKTHTFLCVHNQNISKPATRHIQQQHKRCRSKHANWISRAFKQYAWPYRQISFVR